ncbi:TnsA-like heteromeric transposase endonuclease subunit [Streptomyces sp. NPDC058322]|uniref:TnsA-like heteromeric transposase endonuclease subunit n=1 Tax=Streptomyces sp. NPDC058322 TaxID=3346446 RepID=UPI0036E5D0D6
MVGIASHPFWLHWHDGREPRRHAPDHFVPFADGRARVVDVRSVDRLDERAEEAFEATQEACGAVGWAFDWADTPEPVFMANVRWLARCRGRAGWRPAAGSSGAVPPAVVRPSRCPARCCRTVGCWLWTNGWSARRHGQ